VKEKATYPPSEKKNFVDGWANYEGEVSRFEDRYHDKENTAKVGVPTEEDIVILDTLSSKTPSPTGQVWKPKVNSKLNPVEDTTPVAPSDVPLNH